MSVSKTLDGVPPRPGSSITFVLIPMNICLLLRDARLRIYYHTHVMTHTAPGINTLLEAKNSPAQHSTALPVAPKATFAAAAAANLLDRTPPALPSISPPPRQPGPNLGDIMNAHVQSMAHPDTAQRTDVTHEVPPPIILAPNDMPALGQTGTVQHLTPQTH